MKQGRKNIVFILIFVLLTIGSCKKVGIDVHKIDLSAGFSNIEKKIFLSSIASSLCYTLLEAVDESIIGEITKISFSNNYIVVFDRKLGKLLLFNSNGAYLRTIGKIGKGPNEFTGIEDLILDEDNGRIYLYVSDWSIKAFNLNGELVNNYPIKYPFWIFDLLNDDYLMFYMPFPNTRVYGGYSIFIYSLAGAEKNKLLRRDISREPDCEMGPTLFSYKYHDTLCFWESFYDTIYGISKNKKIVPRWTFKHAKSYLNVEMQKKGQFDLDNTYFFSNMIETDDYFFLSGYDKRRVLKVLYSKEDETVSEVVYNYKIVDHGFHNDLDGGYPFWPTGKINDNCLYSIIEPTDFIEIMNCEYNNKLPKNNNYKINELINSITPMSNPIIMKAILK